MRFAPTVDFHMEVQETRWAKKRNICSDSEPGLANRVAGNRLTEHGDHHLTCAPVAPGFGVLSLNVWGRSWAVYFAVLGLLRLCMGESTW